MRINKNNQRPKTPYGSFSRIGKVKVGKKVERYGKMQPSSIDYFRFTVTHEGESKDLWELQDLGVNNPVLTQLHNNLQKIGLGDKPKFIPIVFDSDGIGACSQYLSLYNHKGQEYVRTDGENEIWISTPDRWVLLRKEDFDNEQVNPIRVRKGKDGSEQKCKLYGDNIADLMEKLRVKAQSKATSSSYEAAYKEMLTLRFRITISGLYGLFEFNTKSITSISQIVAMFDEVMEKNGTVVGVPFALQVNKVKTARAAKANRYTVVNLIPIITKENNLVSQVELQGVKKTLALESGNSESANNLH